jgi:hypothetical protein
VRSGASSDGTALGVLVIGIGLQQAAPDSSSAMPERRSRSASSRISWARIDRSAGSTVICRKLAAQSGDVPTQLGGDRLQSAGGLAVPQAVLQPAQTGEVAVVHSARQFFRQAVDHVAQVTETTRALRRVHTAQGVTTGAAAWKRSG